MGEIEKVEEIPSKIKVGKVMYEDYTEPSRKDEAEVDAKFARKCGIKTKVKGFDLVGKRGTKRVWVVYGVKGK